MNLGEIIIVVVVATTTTAATAIVIVIVIIIMNLYLKRQFLPRSAEALRIINDHVVFQFLRKPRKPRHCSLKFDQSC